MIDQKALDFLKDLRKNNNRDWFHANKKRYEADLKKPFATLVTSLIEIVKEIDPLTEIQAKDAIFRINRDTRFSKDKTPYKTHVGAIISRFGRKQKEFPGYYVHIEAGRLMLGGGAYFLPTDLLRKVREHIIAHPDTFESIIQEKDFVEKYESIQGSKNKRLPKEMQAAAEQQPLIYNKQFYYMTELPPKIAISSDFIDFCRLYFEAGAQLNQFIMDAIE